MTTSVFISRIRLFATSLVFGIMPAALSASPSVNGTTISWPDDGWYQVQRADTYESVCSGGRSCVVGAGKYIVINHNTGGRFNVTVGSESATPSSVSVENRTISWPDDGWYQVQRLDTYETVCSGGRRCDVEPGNYVVINHSSGVRTEPVTVGDAGSPSTPNQSTSSIQVSSSNEISWPDDGWYEVQNASDYTSVCMGTRSCVVPAGTYTVINHSSGERFDGIEVGGSTPAPDTTTTSGPLVEVPVKHYVQPDGSYGTRSSEWEFKTQWQDTDGNLLNIDSQVQGPTTALSGAQWAVNHSATQLQLLVLGPDNRSGSVEIFWDGNNSKGAQYDGSDDFHIIIPLSNPNRSFWDNNRSADSDGVLLFGDQSASLDSNAIEFATCTCGGINPLWEINIDLAAAKIPLNKAFGFDVRLNWQYRAAGEQAQQYRYGWADATNPERSTPANMGSLILLPD